MMTNDRVEMDAGKNLEITIENVGGALHIKGWERDTWRIEAPGDDDHFVQNKNQLSINAKGDCILRAPTESKLLIQSVGGDAFVVGIEGTIDVEDIGGSLSLKRVGASAIKQVSGHLFARSIEGDLSADVISGNATIRDIEGTIQAGEILGSLSLRDVGYKATALVSGNGNLRLDPAPGAQIEIRCRGNAYCRLESPGNAEINLKSKSGRILVQTSEGSQSIESNSHQLKFGNGEARVTIEADGHIDFRCRESSEGFGIGFDLDLDLGEDIEDLVGEISDQVGVQMEAQLEALNEQLDALSEQLKVSGSRAVSRAQRQVEATQRRLEDKLRARRGKSGRQTFSAAYNLGPQPEPVSDQERMKILEMVQDKKISVQEAEILLATLEGRQPPKPSAAETNAEETNS